MDKQENCWRHSVGRFVGVRVGVAHSRDKLALCTWLRNLKLKSQFCFFIVSEMTAVLFKIGNIFFGSIDWY